MITQIYSIQTKEEALMCVQAGADNIGVAIATGANLPSEVSIETCKEIFDAIDHRATTTLIIVSKSDEPIYKPVEILQPDIIHLCGYDFQANEEFIEKVRKIKPDIKIMQAVGVEDRSSIDQAIYFSNFCDLIILDSVDRKINGIGAAGFTNDWDIDREIVEKAHCPVILAGGLNPDNVRDAILKVRPYGVDSFTQTSDKLENGKTRKNKEKVEAFIKNARLAAKELENE